MTSPTVSQRRRERERLQMTERILDAARALFVRDGYEAVTLNKVAEAIEYSPATIYQYFKDKRALVMAIIRADYVDLRDALLVCRDIANPVERLMQMGRRFAAWGAAHPNHLMLMTVHSPAWAASGQELREHENPPIEEDFLYLLGSFVADVFEAGIVRDNYTDPGVVATTLAAGIHGLVIQEITFSDDERKLLGANGISLEQRVDTLIQVMVDGFLKPGWQKTLEIGHAR
jgi:AcrR family transcriptional regulator